MNHTPSFPSQIQFIVGLCNPGASYAKTRHNAGSWVIETLCKEFPIQLNKENKFQGWLASTTLWEIPCKIFLPSTYMNCCGSAIQAITKYYHIPLSEMLVIHDELDLPPGTARLKYDGGHGGHNGLRDILTHMDSHFARLRIGIGHPGNKQDVSQYVLVPPSSSEKKQIETAIDNAITALPWVLKGEWQKATHYLHSSN